MSARPRPRGASGSPARPMEFVTSFLACAWLVLPTVQYFATLQRTELRLGREPVYPQLVSLDLLYPYAGLLAATVVVAIASSRSRQKPGSTG